MKAKYLDIIWFQSYNPGRGLRKYLATGNHLANHRGQPRCGIRPAYADQRLMISGNRGNSASHKYILIDCRKCSLPP